MAKQKDFLSLIRGLFKPAIQGCLKRSRTSIAELKRLTKTDPGKARKLMHDLYACVIEKRSKR